VKSADGAEAAAPISFDLATESSLTPFSLTPVLIVASFPPAGKKFLISSESVPLSLVCSLTHLM